MLPLPGSPYPVCCRIGDALMASNGAGCLRTLSLDLLLQGSKLLGGWRVVGLASSACCTWTCLPACWRVRSRQQVSAHGMRRS